MNAQLAVVSQWAEDVSAAAHFYREVLGLKLMPRPTEAARPARFPVVAFAAADLEPPSRYWPRTK